MAMSVPARSASTAAVGTPPLRATSTTVVVTDGAVSERFRPPITAHESEAPRLRVGGGEVLKNKSP
jgi:hypothetical protein